MIIDKLKRLGVIFIVFLSIPRYIFFFKRNPMKTIISDIEKTKKIERRQKYPIIKVVKAVRLFVIVFQFSKNCFLRSYVTFKVLSDLGISTNFKVGVNSDNKFKSHSWLEIDNKLLEEQVKKIEMMSVIYSLEK